VFGLLLDSSASAQKTYDDYIAQAKALIADEFRSDLYYRNSRAKLPAPSSLRLA
jgi:hypothetical protein